MSQVSISPHGESFPLSEVGDYGREYERLRIVADEARAQRREIVVVMGVGFVAIIRSNVVIR